MERLADSGYLDESDCLLDYGCGKGRVPIYLYECVGCKTIGIEIENEFYEDALGNVNAYMERYQKDPDAIHIFHTKAQTFEVPDEVTACFFFNPFSSDILKNVVPQILESAKQSPRRIYIFLFYPSDAYIAYLSQIDTVMFVDEIDCTDLFPQVDPRNRIMIYEIDEY